MRWMRWAPLALVVFTPALIAAGQAPRPGTLIQAGRRVRYVYTDREALLLMPPELVALPSVQHADWAQWSPDSRYVIARREYVRLLTVAGPPPPGEVSLVIWKAKTRHAVEAWKQPSDAYSIEQISWLHGADVAFATAVWTPPAVVGNPPPERRRVLLRIDAARGAVKPVASLSMQEELLASP